MKVLSCLQLMKLPNIEQSYYEEMIGKKFNCFELEIEDFYSQLFKPELITELFGGWSYNSVEGNFHKFYNGLNHIRIYPTTDVYKIIVYYTNFEETEFFTPRTLDDFINDCQRAGIELIWKRTENESKF